eukprot:1150374-Pelagomonas_calceolata.AAC.2
MIFERGWGMRVRCKRYQSACVGMVSWACIKLMNAMCKWLDRPGFMHVLHAASAAAYAVHHSVTSVQTTLAHAVHRATYSQHSINVGIKEWPLPALSYSNLKS